jgi:uncharacterized protein YlxW (UPF0749 family)
LQTVRQGKFAGLGLLALVALATGFVLAGQLRTQLLTPSNQLARYQALIRSVQDLEATNAKDRRQIAALRTQIAALEADAAARSAETQALQGQVADLRAHAGLVAMHGPGVEVQLRNGAAGPNGASATSYLVNFQDVQDLVNFLFGNGAEAIAVSGRRITPLSSFSGSAGQVVIDQGPPLSSPVTVDAIGDRNRMSDALADPFALPDLREREVQFQLQVTFRGVPDTAVPAYDSSLQIPHVQPA